MNKLIAIAINEYSEPKIVNLSNCLNDANSIIDILSNKYYIDSVNRLFGLSQTTLKELYNFLYDLFLNAFEDDNIIILYAGHGEYNPHLGTSYWLCSDSTKSDITTWFNINELLNLFKASKAKHIVLLSDSCFSGAIFENNRGGGIGGLENKISRQALTSGGIEKVSDGKKNTHSPFCIAVQNILNNNKKEKLSFSEFAESAILEFNVNNSQTPTYGSLIDTGHKGGSFFFQLKNIQNQKAITELQLQLKTKHNIKVECNCFIPFLHENKTFDKDFINAFIQQIGYSIINGITIHLENDNIYLRKKSKNCRFYISVNFSIEMFSDNYLSILINSDVFLGSAYPWFKLYTLNFISNPDRKLSLDDIIDYSDFKNLEDFLKVQISIHANDDIKDDLVEYTKAEYINKLHFTLNKKALVIYYVNLLPHAFKAGGYLNIPTAQIKLKHRISYNEKM